jgi:isopentenyl diphosphate isomerase/L-lactate dehydrogenase-like FMN-dependent dehydrogenase
VEILVSELRLAMALLGCPSVRDLDPTWLTAVPEETRSGWST